jgi:aspartate kinase
MTLVVLKFGGTSLANTKLMHNAMAKVIHEVSLGNQVIVVVSAMAGVTDHLVSLTHEISDCDIEDNLAEYANVITTGEQVSAGLFTLLLQREGLKARSWLGWQAQIITDDLYTNGTITDLKCEALCESFSQGYKVAVVAGFQGMTKNNRVSTLGRGGSDTSAIVLAGALKAQRCDIYTDVEGVFSADPRIVAKAHKIQTITYDEMIAFSRAGAKVLQAKSAEWAKHYQVNLRVLSSFTNGSGTIVCKSSNPRSITGIAISDEDNLAQISAIGKNIDTDTSILEKLSYALNIENIQILAIKQEPMLLGFLVKNENKFDAIKILHTACGLNEASGLINE